MTPMLPIKSLGMKLQDHCVSTLAEVDPSISPYLRSIERSLPRGGTLFHDGDQLGYLYEVVSGMIRTSRHFADGRRQVLGFFPVGSLVGAPCPSFASCTAEAVTSTKVLCYPVSQIAASMSQSVALTQTILGTLHKDIKQQEDHIVLLSRRCPDERIALFLLKYCTAVNGSFCGEPKISLPMSRIDIADYLGLTQETVCRVLARFRQTGIITVEGRHRLTVTNLSMLQKMAESGAVVRVQAMYCNDSPATARSNSPSPNEALGPSSRLKRFANYSRS